MPETDAAGDSAAAASLVRRSRRLPPSAPCSRRSRTVGVTDRDSSSGRGCGRGPRALPATSYRLRRRDLVQERTTATMTALRIEAVLTWVYAAGFGGSTIPVAVYLRRRGRLPRFLDLFEMYGGRLLGAVRSGCLRRASHGVPRGDACGRVGGLARVERLQGGRRPHARSAAGGGRVLVRVRPADPEGGRRCPRSSPSPWVDVVPLTGRARSAGRAHDRVRGAGEVTVSARRSTR